MSSSTPPFLLGPPFKPNFLGKVQHTSSINVWIMTWDRTTEFLAELPVEEGRSIPAPGSFARWGFGKDGFHLLTQSQWLRSWSSSYQLFAEKERDAGFAADSPVVKFCTCSNWRLRTMMLCNCCSSFRFLSLVMPWVQRRQSPWSYSWTADHMLEKSSGLCASV